MVHATRQLSNFSPQLRRVFSSLERAGWPDSSPLVWNMAAGDMPKAHYDMVATELQQPNRKLKPAEIDDLVSRYKQGATIAYLASYFSIHTQTVRAHLQARNVKLRRMYSLTSAEEDEVIRLYAEERQTLEEIAIRFGNSAASIRRALIRRGIARRPRR